MASPLRRAAAAKELHGRLRSTTAVLECPPVNAEEGTRPGRDSPLLWGLSFLAYVSALARMLLLPPEEGTPGTLAYGYMAVFLALAVSQIALRRRVRWSTHVFLGL